MTEDIFYSKYNTEYNQVLLAAKSPNISPDDMCSFGGAMYETYGEELEYVRKQDSNHIWTVLDGEGRHLWVVAGFHYINRLGYLITEQPWESKDEEYKF